MLDPACATPSSRAPRRAPRSRRGRPVAAGEGGDNTGVRRLPDRPAPAGRRRPARPAAGGVLRPGDGGRPLRRRGRARRRPRPAAGQPHRDRCTSARPRRGEGRRRRGAARRRSPRWPAGSWSTAGPPASPSPPPSTTAAPTRPRPPPPPRSAPPPSSAGCARSPTRTPRRPCSRPNCARTTPWACPAASTARLRSRCRCRAVGVPGSPHRRGHVSGARGTGRSAVHQPVVLSDPNGPLGPVAARATGWVVRAVPRAPSGLGPSAGGGVDVSGPRCEGPW